MSTSHKGTLNPGKLENPDKYQGDIRKIIYRSSWERECFLWCDKNPSVLNWASEELFISYEHPVKGHRARYYPDLWLKMADGSQKIVEIKPKKQTIQPDPPKRRTPKYIEEIATYLVNNEKWEAARKVCEKNEDLTFEIWTEEQLTEMGLLKTAPKRDPRESHRSRPKLKPVGEKTVRAKRPRPRRRS